MRISPQPDPRAAGIAMLDRLLPLPKADAEERAERKLIRRMDIREAVRR